MQQTTLDVADVTAPLPHMGLHPCPVWACSMPSGQLKVANIVQLREAAAAAMARHKAEQPKQAMERAIDIPGQSSGRQAQPAKRGQRQYRQRGGDDELEGDVMPESALPNQAAGVAAATRMQEQEYEARARAKRARGNLIHCERLRYCLGIAGFALAPTCAV